MHIEAFLLMIALIKASILPFKLLHSMASDDVFHQSESLEFWLLQLLLTDWHYLFTDIADIVKVGMIA